MNPNTLRPTVKTATRIGGSASSDTTGGSGDPPWYCATTRPAYISELSTLTISPPRHDCTVLAAMIGSA